MTESSGAWTKECSAEWIASVVGTAGYRITGDTKAAWVAEGNGRNFYVWATDLTTPVAQIRRREGYEVAGRVDGTWVYDDGTRKFWREDRYLIWIEAARADPSAPTVAELRPLILASEELEGP